jgi:hypothetical protein
MAGQENGFVSIPQFYSREIIMGPWDKKEIPEES